VAVVSEPEKNRCCDLEKEMVMIRTALPAAFFIGTFLIGCDRTSERTDRKTGTHDATSEKTDSEAGIYTDTRNGYFMFLPPRGWTPQTYDDPRTKVAFSHPTAPGVLIRFIVREAPGETFDGMVHEDRQVASEMRTRGVSCEVRKNDVYGMACSEVYGQFPNDSGTMMLRKFLTCGLHFNIQYSAPSKTLFDRYLDEATRSLETITVLKVSGRDVAKAKEQQIANRVRLAKLTAQWVSIEEGKRILREARKEFPESNLIEVALKEMEDR